MKRIFVLAGNWQEYQYWCHEQDNFNAVPVLGPHTLIGVHFPADGKIVTTGTWKNRADMAQISRQIEINTYTPEGQLHMDFEEIYGRYL
jgi:hypothetical protein